MIVRHSNDIREIAVIGGGPAGVLSAIALAKNGHRVTVLEQTHYNDFRVGEHISPSACNALYELGLSDLVDEVAHQQCERIQSIWEHEEPIVEDYWYTPFGKGFNLSRPIFDLDLADVARSWGVDILCGTRPIHAERKKDQWAIGLDGTTLKYLRVDFVVDASGRNAWFTRAMGQKKINYDRLVGLTAIVPRATHDSIESNELLIEAVENGWWYTSALRNNTIVATFMTDYDILPKRLGRMAFWCDNLKRVKSTRRRLGKLPTDLYVRPANTQVTSNIIGPGWISVGDAASAYDPLSSSGIEKGITTATEAASAIHQSILGNDAALDDYRHYVITNFRQYLDRKSYYYRLVTRWPQSAFWSRRQKPVASQQAITLSPLEVISIPKNIKTREIDTVLRDTNIGIDSTFFAKYIGWRGMTHRLVEVYLEERRYPTESQDVILAVQRLMDSGLVQRG